MIGKKLLRVQTWRIQRQKPTIKLKHLGLFSFYSWNGALFFSKKNKNLSAVVTGSSQNDSVFHYKSISKLRADRWLEKEGLRVCLFFFFSLSREIWICFVEHSRFFLFLSFILSGHKNPTVNRVYAHQECDWAVSFLQPSASGPRIDHVREK